MSDGTQDPCLGGAWAANVKAMFEQFLKRAEELDNHFDKLVVDAQSAANLALLNAVNTADLIAKKAVRDGDLAVANEWQEQQTGAGISQDDVAKITEAVTAAITAVLANMATGRPPANVTGTTPAA